MSILCIVSQRSQEHCAGRLGAEEDRAQADGPGNHGGNSPSGLQCRRVKHPLAGEAAHERDAHHAADADQPRHRGLRHALRQAAELVHVSCAGSVLHRTGIEE